MRTFSLESAMRFFISIFFFILPFTIFSFDFSIKGFQDFTKERDSIYNRASFENNEPMWNLITQYGQSVIIAQWQQDAEDNMELSIEEELKADPSKNEADLRTQLQSIIDSQKAILETELEKEALVKKGQWLASITPIVFDTYEFNKLKEDILTANPLIIGEDLVGEFTSWDQEIKKTTDLLIENFNVNLDSYRTSMIDIIADRTQEEKDAFIEKLDERLNELKDNTRRKETMMILEERNTLFYKSTHDLDSLKSKSQSLTAENIVHNILNETEDKTQDLLDNSSIANYDPFTKIMSSDEYSDEIKRFIQEGLGMWRKAEERLIAERIKWSQEAERTYDEADQQWSDAFDQLKERKENWFTQMRLMVLEGNQQWADAFDNADDDYNAALDDLDEYINNQQETWDEYSANLREILISGNSVIKTALENLTMLKELQGSPNNQLNDDEINNQIASWEKIISDYRKLMDTARLQYHGEDITRLDSHVLLATGNFARQYSKVSSSFFRQYRADFETLYNEFSAGTLYTKDDTNYNGLTVENGQLGNYYVLSHYITHLEKSNDIDFAAHFNSFKNLYSADERTTIENLKERFLYIHSSFQSTSSITSLDNLSSNPNPGNSDAHKAMIYYHLQKWLDSDSNTSTEFKDVFGTIYINKLTSGLLTEDGKDEFGNSVVYRGTETDDFSTIENDPYLMTGAEYDLEVLKIQKKYWDDRLARSKAVLDYANSNDRPSEAEQLAEKKKAEDEYNQAKLDYDAKKTELADVVAAELKAAGDDLEAKAKVLNVAREKYDAAQKEYNNMLHKYYILLNPDAIIIAQREVAEAIDSLIRINNAIENKEAQWITAAKEYYSALTLKERSDAGVSYAARVKTALEIYYGSQYTDDTGATITITGYKEAKEAFNQLLINKGITLTDTDELIKAVDDNKNILFTVPSAGDSSETEYVKTISSAIDAAKKNFDDSVKWYNHLNGAKDGSSEDKILALLDEKLIDDGKIKEFITEIVGASDATVLADKISVLVLELNGLVTTGALQAIMDDGDVIDKKTAIENLVFTKLASNGYTQSGIDIMVSLSMSMKENLSDDGLGSDKIINEDLQGFLSFLSISEIKVFEILRATNLGLADQKKLIKILFFKGILTKEGMDKDEFVINSESNGNILDSIFSTFETLIDEKYNTNLFNAKLRVEQQFLTIKQRVNLAADTSQKIINYLADDLSTPDAQTLEKIKEASTQSLDLTTSKISYNREMYGLVRDLVTTYKESDNLYDSLKNHVINEINNNSTEGKDRYMLIELYWFILNSKQMYKEIERTTDSIDKAKKLDDLIKEFNEMPHVYTILDDLYNEINNTEFEKRQELYQRLTKTYRSIIQQEKEPLRVDGKIQYDSDGFVIFSDDDITEETKTICSVILTEFMKPGTFLSFNNQGSYYDLVKYDDVKNSIINKELYSYASTFYANSYEKEKNFVQDLPEILKKILGLDKDDNLDATIEAINKGALTYDTLLSYGTSIQLYMKDATYQDLPAAMKMALEDVARKFKSMLIAQKAHLYNLEILDELKSDTSTELTEAEKEETIRESKAASILVDIGKYEDLAKDLETLSSRCSDLIEFQEGVKSGDIDNAINKITKIREQYYIVKASYESLEKNFEETEISNKLLLLLTGSRLGVESNLEDTFAIIEIEFKRAEKVKFFFENEDTFKTTIAYKEQLITTYNFEESEAQRIINIIKNNLLKRKIIAGAMGTPQKDDDLSINKYPTLVEYKNKVQSLYIDTITYLTAEEKIALSQEVMGVIIPKAYLGGIHSGLVQVEDFDATLYEVGSYRNYALLNHFSEYLKKSLGTNQLKSFEDLFGSTNADGDFIKGAFASLTQYSTITDNIETLMTEAREIYFKEIISVYDVNLPYIDENNFQDNVETGLLELGLYFYKKSQSFHVDEVKEDGSHKSESFENLYVIYLNDSSLSDATRSLISKNKDYLRELFKVAEGFQSFKDVVTEKYLNVDQLTLLCEKEFFNLNISTDSYGSKWVTMEDFLGQYDDVFSDSVEANLKNFEDTLKAAWNYNEGEDIDAYIASLKEDDGILSGDDAEKKENYIRLYALNPQLVSPDYLLDYTGTREVELTGALLKHINKTMINQMFSQSADNPMKLIAQMVNDFKETTSIFKGAYQAISNSLTDFNHYREFLGDGDSAHGKPQDPNDSNGLSMLESYIASELRLLDPSNSNIKHDTYTEEDENFITFIINEDDDKHYQDLNLNGELDDSELVEENTVKRFITGVILGTEKDSYEQFANMKLTFTMEDDTLSTAIISDSFDDKFGINIRGYSDSFDALLGENLTDFNKGLIKLLQSSTIASTDNIQSLTISKNDGSFYVLESTNPLDGTAGDLSILGAQDIRSISKTVKDFTAKLDLFSGNKKTKIYDFFKGTNTFDNIKSLNLDILKDNQNRIKGIVNSSEGKFIGLDENLKKIMITLQENGPVIKMDDSAIAAMLQNIKDFETGPLALRKKDYDSLQAEYLESEKKYNAKQTQYLMQLETISAAFKLLEEKRRNLELANDLYDYAITPYRYVSQNSSSDSDDGNNYDARDIYNEVKALHDQTALLLTAQEKKVKDQNSKDIEKNENYKKLKENLIKETQRSTRVETFAIMLKEELDRKSQAYKEAKEDYKSKRDRFLESVAPGDDTATNLINELMETYVVNDGLENGIQTNEYGYSQLENDIRQLAYIKNRNYGAYGFNDRPFKRPKGVFDLAGKTYQEYESDAVAYFSGKHDNPLYKYLLATNVNDKKIKGNSNLNQALNSFLTAENFRIEKNEKLSATIFYSGKAYAYGVLAACFWWNWPVAVGLLSASASMSVFAIINNHEREVAQGNMNGELKVMRKNIQSFKDDLIDIADARDKEIDTQSQVSEYFGLKWAETDEDKSNIKDFLYGEYKRLIGNGFKDNETKHYGELKIDGSHDDLDLMFETLTSGVEGFQAPAQVDYVNDQKYYTYNADDVIQGYAAYCKDRREKALKAYLDFSQSLTTGDDPFDQVQVDRAREKVFYDMLDDTSKFGQQHKAYIKTYIDYFAIVEGMNYNMMIDLENKIDNVQDMTATFEQYKGMDNVLSFNEREFQQRKALQSEKWNLQTTDLENKQKEWDKKINIVFSRGAQQWANMEDEFIKKWKAWRKETEDNIDAGRKAWDAKWRELSTKKQDWIESIGTDISQKEMGNKLNDITTTVDSMIADVKKNYGSVLGDMNLKSLLSEILQKQPDTFKEYFNKQLEVIKGMDTDFAITTFSNRNYDSAIFTEFDKISTDFENNLKAASNMQLLVSLQKLMENLKTQVTEADKNARHQSEQYAAGQGFHMRNGKLQKFNHFGYLSVNPYSMYIERDGFNVDDSISDSTIRTSNGGTKTINIFNDMEELLKSGTGNLANLTANQDNELLLKAMSKQMQLNFEKIFDENNDSSIVKHIGKFPDMQKEIRVWGIIPYQTLNDDAKSGLQRYQRAVHSLLTTEKMDDFSQYERIGYAIYLQNEVIEVTGGALSITAAVAGAFNPAKWVDYAFDGVETILNVVQSVRNGNGDWLDITKSIFNDMIEGSLNRYGLPKIATKSIMGGVKFLERGISINENGQVDWGWSEQDLIEGAFDFGSGIIAGAIDDFMPADNGKSKWTGKDMTGNFWGNLGMHALNDFAMGYARSGFSYDKDGNLEKNEFGEWYAPNIVTAFNGAVGNAVGKIASRYLTNKSKDLGGSSSGSDPFAGFNDRDYMGAKIGKVFGAITTQGLNAVTQQQYSFSQQSIAWGWRDTLGYAAGEVGGAIGKEMLKSSILNTMLFDKGNEKDSKKRQKEARRKLALLPADERKKILEQIQNDGSEIGVDDGTYEPIQMDIYSDEFAIDYSDPYHQYDLANSSQGDLYFPGQGGGCVTSDDAGKITNVADGDNKKFDIIKLINSEANFLLIALAKAHGKEIGPFAKHVLALNGVKTVQDLQKIIASGKLRVPEGVSITDAVQKQFTDSSVRWKDDTKGYAKQVDMALTEARKSNGWDGPLGGSKYTAMQESKRQQFKEKFFTDKLKKLYEKIKSTSDSAGKQKIQNAINFLEQNKSAYLAGYQIWGTKKPKDLNYKGPGKHINQFAYQDDNGKYYMIWRVYETIGGPEYKDGLLRLLTKPKEISLKKFNKLKIKGNNKVWTYCNYAANAFSHQFGAPKMTEWFKGYDSKGNPNKWGEYGAQLLPQAFAKGYFNNANGSFQQVSNYKEAEKLARSNKLVFGVINGHIGTVIGGYKNSNVSKENLMIYQAGRRTSKLEGREHLFGPMSLRKGFGSYAHKTTKFWVWRKK